MECLPTYFVYGLRLTGEDCSIVYVGQTGRTVVERFRQHLWTSQTSSYPLYRWIRKNEGRIEYVILQVCDSQEELDLAEIEWIDKLSTHISNNGYNLTTGGGGTRGATWTLSVETRKKQSDAVRLRLSTLEAKEALSQRMKTYFSDPINITKHSEATKLYNTPQKGQYANHKRWHLSRSIIKPGCEFCLN